MIELFRADNGVDWCVRVSFATQRKEARFAVFRRACDWGRDVLEHLEAAA